MPKLRKSEKKHSKGWWILGMDTKDVPNWGPFATRAEAERALRNYQKGKMLSHEDKKGKMLK